MYECVELLVLYCSSELHIACILARHCLFAASDIALKKIGVEIAIRTESTEATIRISMIVKPFRLPEGEVNFISMRSFLH